MGLFDKVTIRGAESVIDEASGAEVFHVENPHAFVQASGYLKYVRAKDHAENVYYRGQRRYHEGLSPSLFRGVATKGDRDGRITALKSFLRDFVEASRGKGRLLDSFPEEMLEPLLQHYGVRTSWVDLVDNVWVALWFACYRAHTAGEFDTFLHFEKRLPRREEEQERFAYVVLVATEMVERSQTPGLWRGPRTELADLRIGVPSVFVRPHAQHGVLFRLRGGPGGGRETDYVPAVLGALRVALPDALDWLGEGSLLDVHALFPPPHYDEGYRILLKQASDNEVIPNSVIGGVHHVGA